LIANALNTLNFLEAAIILSRKQGFRILWYIVMYEYYAAFGQQKAASDLLHNLY